MEIIKIIIIIILLVLIGILVEAMYHTTSNVFRVASLLFIIFISIVIAFIVRSFLNEPKQFS
jgi:hypothetical protein